jgi:transcriptional regulator with XRE-family HTH domain
MDATPPGPERFGRWLDLTMSNRDITGRQIAKKCKVHDSTVSRWRAGQAVPTMDAAVRLGRLLSVDPLKIAATAGLIDGELVNVTPLPMPEPTAQRRYVKDQIMKIRYLSEADKQLLINTYDERLGEEE